MTDTPTKEQPVQSIKIIRIIRVAAIIGGVLIVFHLGVETGYQRAKFVASQSQTYYDAFGPIGGIERPMALRVMTDDVASPHGVAGEVLSTRAEDIIVLDRDGIEKTVHIDGNTLVKKLRGKIKPNEIISGDFVVVIGKPQKDNGKISAQLVRVVPPRK